MSHHIKLCGGALVTYSFAALETKFAGFVLVQFTAIRHCFSVLAFISEAIFHLWNHNRLVSIGQVHGAFITKKYDTLTYLRFFSLLFLKGTAKEACAQVSSIRCTHVKRDRPQPRIEPVTQDLSSARYALGQVAAKAFACMLHAAFST